MAREQKIYQQKGKKANARLDKLAKVKRKKKIEAAAARVGLVGCIYKQTNMQQQQQQQHWQFVCI